MKKKNLIQITFAKKLKYMYTLLINSFITGPFIIRGHHESEEVVSPHQLRFRYSFLEKNFHC